MKKNKREDVKIFFSVYEAPSGVGGIVANNKGLLEVFLPVKDAIEDMISKISKFYPTVSGENTLTRKASELLRRYFSGQKVSFDLPLDMEDCTEFRRDVYEAVSRIPYGSVRTYAEIASEIKSPKSSRGVGSAMAKNLLPIIIPCHRVIGSDGKMTGYSAPGGTDMKEALLRMEGVIFDDGEKRVKKCTLQGV